jgi:uncharacterized protein (DUF2225 family)
MQSATRLIDRVADCFAI